MLDEFRERDQRSITKTLGGKPFLGTLLTVDQGIETHDPRAESLDDLTAGAQRGSCRDQIIEQASLFRIPVSPVGNGHTVTEMDHLVERAVFVDHPAGFKQPRRPYRLGHFPDPPVPETVVLMSCRSSVLISVSSVFGG